MVNDSASFSFDLDSIVNDERIQKLAAATGENPVLAAGRYIQIVGEWCKDRQDVPFPAIFMASHWNPDHTLEDKSYVEYLVESGLACQVEGTMYFTMTLIGSPKWQE